MSLPGAVQQKAAQESSCVTSLTFSSSQTWGRVRHQSIPYIELASKQWRGEFVIVEV